MRELLNQHSYLAVAVLFVGVAWLVLQRLSAPWRWLGLGVTVLAVIVAALILRTEAGDVRSRTDLDRVLAEGKPVALEFFSNY